MVNREFLALSKLNHPLIAELLEVYIDPNFVYFVSPFYQGGELSDLLTFEAKD
jgi:serine/threonine protein kinase